MPAAYVSGLIEGAGSFTYHRAAGQLTLVFALRASHANRGLLEELRAFFGGAGRLYDTRAPRAGAASRDACLLRVTRPSELLRIVAHFESHPLRGNKARIFRTWREMVLLRAAHLGSPPPAELALLAEQLTRERRRDLDTRVARS